METHYQITAHSWFGNRLYLLIEYQGSPGITILPTIVRRPPTVKIGGLGG